MKTSILSLLALLTILFTSCNTLKLPSGTPECVEKKIKEIQAAPASNPPTEVWLWKADGSSYYYFTSPCCDQFNYLYDNNCTLVCAPDGGFTGKGDGKCPQFTGKVEKTLIWEDKR